RLVAVQWGGSGKETFPVTMHIVAYDREGLVRDIAAVVADEQLSINGMTVGVQRDQTAVVTATVNVPGLEKLSRVMARIGTIRNVLDVQRDTGGVTKN